MKVLSISSMLAVSACLAFGQTVEIARGSSSNVICASSGVCYTSGVSTITAGSGLSFGGSSNFQFVSERKPKLPLQTIAQVRSYLAPVSKSLLATVAYLKVAKEIGLESASTDEAKLAQALQDRDVKIYNFDRVDAYLYNKAGAQSGNGVTYRWVWKAMRPKDKDKLVANEDASSGTNAFYEGMGLVRFDLYKNAIPQRVIEAAACILDDAPDAILLVSDYEAVKPDPFLAITTPRMLAAHKIFIIDQWDEPGFNDGKEPVTIRQIASR